MPSTPLAARRAIEQIRASIGIYRWVPVLAIVASLIAAAIAALLGVTVISTAFGGSITAPSFNNSTSASVSTVAPGWSSLLSGVSGIIGLASLILTILGWVSWRSGIRQLEEAEGTVWSPRESTMRAVRYYRATVAIFLLTIALSIAIVAIVFSIIFGAIASGLASGSPVSAASLGSSIRVALLSAIALGGAMNIALYGCAGTSLRAVLRPLLDPLGAARIDRARVLLVAGAAFGLSGVLVIVSPYLLFLAVVGPILLIVGFQEFRRSYQDWLMAHPPDLSSLPAPPSGSGLR